jgi:hypothetical protein
VSRTGYALAASSEVLGAVGACRSWTAAMDWSRKAACRLWQRIATTCRVSRTGYALAASSEAPGAVAAD